MGPEAAALGHLTRGEILSQPEVWRKALASAEANKSWLGALIRENAQEAPILLSGCGASYYIAMTAARSLQHLTGYVSCASPASELLVAPSSVMAQGKQQLLISISRSGQSTEIVMAQKRFSQEQGNFTLAVTCEGSSELAQQAMRCLAMDGALEESVVMTRSFGAMLLPLQCAAAYAVSDTSLLSALRRLPDVCFSIIERSASLMRDLAEVAQLKKFIFLGSGPYYGIASEGALAMREMAIESCSECYHTLEYRHGPISTLDESTLVVLMALDTATEYETNLVRDLRRRGATTLVICETAEDKWLHAADSIVELSSGMQDYARTALYLLPLQFLALYRALRNGQDPDRPRHLSHVVTL